MHNITIRRAQLEDAENLTVLKQQVWIANYAVEGIRKEFSDYVLSTFTVENSIKTVLDNDNIALIAESASHLMGSIEVRLHPEYPILEVKNTPEITLLYILERFCGVGLGQELLDAAFTMLKDMGFTSAWLSVLYSNERALRFYSKNAFKDVGKIYFEMDGNKYENRVLVRNL